MPLLWLLLPFAAAVVYFAMPRGARTFGVLDPTAPEPELPLDESAGVTFYPAPAAGPVAAEFVAELPLVGVADYVLNLPAKLFKLPAAARPYETAIQFTEQRYGIPESVLARLLYQESRFRPDIIEGRTPSSAGALGIAQLMPGTARELGVDPLNAPAAIDAAGRYLKQQFDRFGSWATALAAYNWGPGNVARKGVAAAPAETRNYVANILSLGAL